MSQTSTADRAEAFALVFLLAQELTRRADKELARFGLSTSQWLLLAVLARGFAGRPVRLGEAAAVYGTSRQNVKKVAQQLEAKSFVELRPDPSDGRALLIELTPEVRRFDAPREVRRQERLLHDLFTGLDEDEVASLEQLLRRWFDGLREASGPG